MQQNLITELFLPLALAFIMLGMGLSLVPDDFKRIFVYPKAILIGLASQIVLLPIIGYGLVVVFGLSGNMAIGLMILASCPGGPTSNLISHLAKGDIALSITLTAISSCVTVVTIPLLVNFSIMHFGGEGSITLPVIETIGKIVGVTIVPVSIGMLLRNRRPTLSARADKPIKIASGVFFTLILVAAILKERANIVEFFLQVGTVTLILNLATMLMGYLLAKLFVLPTNQQIAISIESGIQNGTLGIMIAATMLNNSEMTIPIAIYSLIMFFTALVVIFMGNYASANAD